MEHASPRADTGAGDAFLQTQFRAPVAEDGRKVWDLVAACPPLDANSMYCNLLQCTDFAKTCVLAEEDGDLIGWVSGYRPPDDPAVLFVWQVAVAEKARGRGLAAAMIERLLARPVLKSVTRLQTTITKGNEASWSLFRRLAGKLEAPLTSEALFDKERHFGGRHSTEYLVTIGPFGGFARH